MAGVAGAPVTDWRNYDTIYTERYMRTPAENREGYDASAAAVELAGNVWKDALLLLHGMVRTTTFIPRIHLAVGGRSCRDADIPVRDAVLSHGDPRHLVPGLALREVVLPGRRARRSG